MTLLCKEKAYYVKACVIPCGVNDAHDDNLGAEDIKRIFTSFNNQDNFELHHNDLPITEVSLLENYISTNEETIAGKIIPKGSWNVVIRVDNPEVKKGLLNKEFGGVSLNNRVASRCSQGLKGRVTYKDLRDAECVIPLLISFVEEPANLIGLEVMSYDVYIQKSKRGDKLSLLDKLKSIIAEEEAENVSVMKDAEPVQEDDAEEETVQVLKDDSSTDSESEEGADDSSEDTNTVEEVSADEEPVEQEKIVKEEETEPADEDEEVVDDEEPVIEKEAEEPTEEPAENDYIAKINALEERITALEEKLKEKEAVDETITEAEPTDEDEPIITKSAKAIIIDEPEHKTDFYELTNRDPLTGKKIRSKTRILN